MNLITLSSNANTLKERDLQFKDSEISVVVLESDLEKGNENPVYYASRYGMIYDPNDDFKPNITPNHKIKGQMVIDYCEQLPKAREIYKELLKKYKKPANTGENNTGQLDALKKALFDANKLIEAQDKEINVLKTTKPETKTSEIEQLQDMIKTLAQVQSNRIEIALKGKTTKVIEKVLHEKFNKVITLLSEDEAVYMYGPAGTGKSQLAEDIAKALELDFYPASTITQEFKLTGYKDAGGEYHETNFYKAMKYGGVFFLDEMDSCIPDVLVGINAALANGYFDFPNGTIRAHENFRVIAAGNTIGRGGNEQYTGRFALDMSTLDRFLGVEINYSDRIDEAVAGGNMELVRFAHAVRKAAAENGIIILMSYRAISKIAKLEKLDFELPEIMNMAVIKGIAADDIKMLTRNMNMNLTNKYYNALKDAV